jgi:predicted nucleic acid-binding protein
MVTSRESDVAIAIEMFRRHQRVDAFDCLLAAIALREGVDGLVSADRAFSLVSGLSWLDLADLDVEDLADR